MGDSGEGLVDAESRIQERMEELERARADRRAGGVTGAEHVRALESLKLARTELQRQLDATTHERRAAGLRDAIAELDRRMAEAGGGQP